MAESGQSHKMEQYIKETWKMVVIVHYIWTSLFSH